MSEPRCRTFPALIPNIRHNNLRVLAKGLAPRLKRIQGISQPDTEKEAREINVKNRAKIGLTTAACARETRPARKTGMVMLERIKVGEQSQEWTEGTGPGRELEGGWEEGPFFRVVDIEAIAGSASSAFRRCVAQRHIKAGSSKLGYSAEIDCFTQVHASMSVTTTSSVEVALTTSIALNVDLESRVALRARRKLILALL